MSDGKENSHDKKESGEEKKEIGNAENNVDTLTENNNEEAEPSGGVPPITTRTQFVISIENDNI
jgi:hypothetical protein